MRVAVSNSSPLILLAKIQCLELLFELFDQVYIPQAVYEEVVENGKLNDQPDAYIIEKFIQVEKISIKTTKNDSNITIKHDLRTLHPGESEAIRLAHSFPTRIILLDDQNARDIARSLKLRVKGTLGIIIDLKDLGKISSAEAISYLNQLNTLMYLSGDLYRLVLKSIM